jgi:two-component system sensor histidine kinase VicK
MEAGKMNLEFTNARIGQVVEEACAGLVSWANSKEIRLEKKIQDNLPELRVDPGRIIQVLNNLISNALKFTPKGGSVTVEAKLHPDGREVAVSVQDTGIGISKEDLKRVFERFLQLGERRQTDVSGTGYLSIAKEIVEMPGGRIGVEAKRVKDEIHFCASGAGSGIIHLN